MTQDQLADLVYQKMKRATDNPGGLRLGPSSTDKAPVIYDPKDNVMIVRDPGAADDGTVFKPDLVKDPNYVNNKFGGSVPSFKPGELGDGPLPPPAEPEPPKPPARAAGPRVVESLPGLPHLVDPPHIPPGGEPPPLSETGGAPPLPETGGAKP